MEVKVNAKEARTLSMLNRKRILKKECSDLLDTFYLMVNKATSVGKVEVEMKVHISPESIDKFQTLFEFLETEGFNIEPDVEHRLNHVLDNMCAADNNTIYVTIGW
jgi:hypothetical protein